MRRSAWAATPRRSSSASRTCTSIGLDRDTDALRIAGERLARFGDRVTLVHTVYDGIADAVTSSGFAAADGILFDLGVSSLQLDVADRGFAYSQDAPLDMRMDQSAGTTAADILATYGEGDLRRIFERYGEEKLAGRYARAIIAARARGADRAVGPTRRDPASRRRRAAVQRAGHPAKRVFQALRIEVNRELSVLERAIPAALGILPVGGRIVVLSYQSLEDRLVKRALRRGIGLDRARGPARRASRARAAVPTARQGRRARHRTRSAR